MNGLIKKVEAWHIDIDHYLNPYIPPSLLPRLPVSVSWFLGYRKEHHQDVGNVVAAWWSGVGAFCGLAVIAAVFNNTASIQARHPPAMIASFGASAVLEYNAIRSPLGQPRNAVLGHMISALIGVGITKLFLLHPDFESLKWIAAALACGLSSAVMLLTGTVHPPGGASAVLAATEPLVTAMGWYFVGLVMLGTSLMVLVGLVVNNIQRQFPVYWWTPIDLRQLHAEIAAGEDPEPIVPDGQGGLREKGLQEMLEDKALHSVQVSAFGIEMPEDLPVSGVELEVLQCLRERLRKRLDLVVEEGRKASSEPSMVDGGFA